MAESQDHAGVFCARKPRKLIFYWNILSWCILWMSFVIKQGSVKLSFHGQHTTKRHDSSSQKKQVGVKKLIFSCYISKKKKKRWKKMVVIMSRHERLEWEVSSRGHEFCLEGLSALWAELLPGLKHQMKEGKKAFSGLAKKSLLSLDLPAEWCDTLARCWAPGATTATTHVPNTCLR